MDLLTTKKNGKKVPGEELIILKQPTISQIHVSTVCLAPKMTEEEKGQAIVEDIVQRPVVATWIQTIELGYESSAKDNAAVTSRAVDDDGSSAQQPVCFQCGKSAQEAAAAAAAAAAAVSVQKLLKCAKCGVAGYCSRECQVLNWKPPSKGGGNHKHSCTAYARLQTLMIPNNDNGTNKNKNIHAIQVKTDEDKKNVRNEIFGRIRIYACSYAVFRTVTLGRGFLFVQSDSTLATLSTPSPKDGLGHPIKTMRAILMHFLTLGEYDAEVCRDDFEMTMVRSNLQKVVEEYDERTQVVLLMRFRCGHVALGKGTLVPDYNVCKTIGSQYFGENASQAVQLNLDDM